MTLVKVCGLTRERDVEAACALGASYLGFNFSALSPRRVGLDRARQLASATPPGVARVGVFVEETYSQIEDAVVAARLELVQLHRPLRGEDVERIPRPIIAVAHAGVDDDVPPPELLARCAAILFDAGAAGAAGGSGSSFDWSLIESRPWLLPLFVAGGLSPENVAESIRRLRPRVVDVASGVESSPGVKDEARMRRFFEAVRRADATA